MNTEFNHVALFQGLKSLQRKENRIKILSGNVNGERELTLLNMNYPGYETLVTVYVAAMGEPVFETEQDTSLSLEDVADNIRFVFNLTCKDKEPGLEQRFQLNHGTVQEEAMYRSLQDSKAAHYNHRIAALMEGAWIQASSELGLTYPQ